jgi:chromosome segregation ATPase
VGIDEIDVAYITSYSGVSEAESLTKDDDDDDDALEEVARLQEEKKSLENKVVELQQSLNQTQTKLESVICKNELSATAPQSRVDHSSELKIVELGNLLEQKQSELDKLATANLEISLKFSSLQTEYDTLNKPSSLQQARISNLESKVEELQKLLTRTQLDLDKKINDIAEAKATIIRVQSERDSLQQQLIQAEESMHQTSLDSADKITTPALESMKVKNNQLQNSLADLESLYKSLCVEKSNMEKSIEITSNRFKDLLSEKETLQSSLKRERKRINWCNQILQDASQSAFTLIAELQTELKRANCTTAVVSDSSQSPMSALSDCSSESKTLMHHAEVLQKQLVELKQTNQHLMLVLHTLLPNAADGVVEAIEELTALSTSNEHAANQTFATAGSDSSGDMNVIQQMIENAKNSRNAKVDGEMKRLVRSLENETKANPMPKRDKSTSPTNSSPTLSRALSMKRLWRKKSGP